MKILWPSAGWFTYYRIALFYSFSTKAAKSFLPCSYSSNDSIVIVIVCIDNMYFCQKGLPASIREFLIKRLT
jgi:hypothetical protein